jgi:quercetin dioxygenase-like cupin family protein
MVEELKIIEQSNEVTAYDCGKVYYVRLKKGGILSDHNHSHQETVFLMEGEAEVILGDKIITAKAPVKLVIPPNIHHKFTAITDIIGLEIK